MSMRPWFIILGTGLIVGCLFGKIIQSRPRSPGLLVAEQPVIEWRSPPPFIWLANRPGRRDIPTCQSRGISGSNPVGRERLWMRDAAGPTDTDRASFRGAC